MKSYSCCNYVELTDEIAKHVAYISDLLEIPQTESNKDTPKRVAKMLAYELFENRNDRGLDKLNKSMTTFPNEGNGGYPISISGISFSSTCEHHWLPFFGTVEVTYVPSDHIIGLSKIPRVVRYFSRRPQLQERFTNDIGNYLVKLLNPKELYVNVKARHTCVMCRGAESDCETETFFNYNINSQNGGVSGV